MNRLRKAGIEAEMQAKEYKKVAKKLEDKLEAAEKELDEINNIPKSE